MWDIFKLKKAGIFAGGVLFGTAGVKILARLRLSTKQKKQKRQKLRKRIQVRRISKRKKFNSL